MRCCSIVGLISFWLDRQCFLADSGPAATPPRPLARILPSARRSVTPIHPGSPSGRSTAQLWEITRGHDHGLRRHPMAIWTAARRYQRRELLDGPVARSRRARQSRSPDASQPQEAFPDMTTSGIRYRHSSRRGAKKATLESNRRL